MLWSPDVQGFVAVLVIGGILLGAHLVSVHVNAGGRIG